MHGYVTDSRERYIAPLAVGAVAVGLSWFLSTLAKRYGWEYPWWLDSPMPLLIYGFVYSSYDRWLWRLPFLSRLPNLTGSWTGLVSSSRDPTAHNQATLRVRQTWSKLIIELETQHSRSASSMACISLDGSPEPTLSYEYWNEPKGLAADTMQPHRGTAHLRLRASNRLLEGDYYTGRGRGTVGEMRFELCLRRQCRDD